MEAIAPMTISAEQMALLLQTLQQAQSQGGGGGGGGEDEFRRAWKGLPLPTLREGPDWADWNFKWKTVCAEAHGMIIMLVEQAEHCHTAHVGPYQDARQERAARSAYARLSSCTEGASLNIVRSVTNRDGSRSYL